MKRLTSERPQSVSYSVPVRIGQKQDEPPGDIKFSDVQNCLGPWPGGSLTAQELVTPARPWARTMGRVLALDMVVKGGGSTAKRTW